MIFVFGYLPDDIDEKDIREFLNPYAKVSDVFFFEKSDYCSHSEYECMVTFDISNRITGYTLQNRLNNYCWNGHRIHSRMLIF